jgi:hypothetical protein
MEDVRESTSGKRNLEAAAADADRPTAESGDGSSIWEELRARRAKASRRIGEGWERASESVKDYADDHSIRVALSSFALGIAIGALVGAVVASD